MYSHIHLFNRLYIRSSAVFRRFSSSFSSSSTSPTPPTNKSKYTKIGIFACVASISTLAVLFPRLSPSVKSVEDSVSELYSLAKHELNARIKANTTQSQQPAAAVTPSARLAKALDSLYTLVDSSILPFDLCCSIFFHGSAASSASAARFSPSPTPLALDSLHQTLEDIFTLLVDHPDLLSASVDENYVKCLVSVCLLPTLPPALRRESAVLLAEFASNRDVFSVIDSLGDFPLHVFFSQYIDSPYHPHPLDDSLIAHGAFIFRPREERRIRRTEANAIWRAQNPLTAEESEERLISLLRQLSGLPEFVAEIAKRREIAESGELSEALQNFSSLIMSDLDVLSPEPTEAKDDSGFSFGILSRYTYAWANSRAAERSRQLAHRRERYFRLIRLIASISEEPKFRKQLLSDGGMAAVYQLFMNYQEEPRVQVQTARFIANLLVDPPVEAVRAIESSPLFAALVDWAHMDPLAPEPHFIELSENTHYWNNLRVQLKEAANNEQSLRERAESDDWQPPALSTVNADVKYEESLGSLRNSLQAQATRALANLQSATDQFVMKRINQKVGRQDSRTAAPRFPFYADEVFLLSPFLRAFNPIYLPERLFRCSIPGGDAGELNSMKQFLSQAPRPQLKEFLTRFHFPSDYNPPQFDIFLVHGLLGNALSTWRVEDPNSLPTEGMKPKSSAPTVSLPESYYWLESNSFSEREVLWPRDWLPCEIPNSRIVSIGFRSFISGKAESVGRGLSIGNRADEALAKLLQARSGCNDRDLVFLTHSMGGLIVKHLLVKSHHYTAIHSNPGAYRNLLDKWRGTVFFSTPHFGAVLPHQSARTRLIHSLYLPSIEVQDLCQDHPILMNLHQEFTSLVEQRSGVRTLSFGESISTPLINGNDMVKYFVVLPESANPIREQPEIKSKQQDKTEENEESEPTVLPVTASPIDVGVDSTHSLGVTNTLDSSPPASPMKPGEVVRSRSGKQEFILAPNVHHFNICKPKDEDDEIYRKTVEFIVKASQKPLNKRFA